MAKAERLVLLIDGTAADRLMIRHALDQDENIDYAVIEAENATEALHYLRHQTPACLLLDDQLPKSDGVNFLATLTEQRPLACPIVLLTNTNSRQQRVQAMRHGIQDFLPKAGLTAEQLLQAVDVAIERVGMQQQLTPENGWLRSPLAASDGIIITDLAGSIIFMNPVAETLTGRTAAAAQGMMLGQIFSPIAEATGLPVADPIEQLLQTHQASSHAYPILLTGRHGQSVPIDYHAESIQDQQGKRSFILTFRDISGHKAAQETVRQQAELLRLTADHMPNVAAYVGPDERYRFVNATFASWFQRPRHQIIGAHVRELLGNRTYERLRPYRQRALAGEIVTYETSLRFPDGVSRTVWVRNQPHLAADSTVQGIYLFIMDISERKQAEADSDFLANLAETVRMVTDADALLWTVCQRVGDYLALGRCHFIEVDQAKDRAVIHRDYCRNVPSIAGESTLSPYNRSTWGEMAAGRTLVNYDAQQDPRTAAIYENVYAPQQERAYVGVPLLRDGEWQGVFSVTTPHARQWQPREIQLLESVAERTWLAVEKLRLDAAVRANEAQLRALTNNLPGLISIINERQEYEFASRYYQEWLGLDPEQLVGQSVAVTLNNSQSYQAAQPVFQQVLAGTTVSQEHTFRNTMGHLVHAFTTLVPRRTADGRVTGWYNLTLNITERKQAEADAHFLADLAETIRLATDEEAFWRQVTQRVGDYLTVDRCHFSEIDEAENRVQIHCDYCRGVPSVAGELPLSAFDQLTWGEMAAGRTLINHNVRQDPRTATRYATTYEPMGWGAYIGVPLLRDEQWQGVFAVTTLDPRQWQPREIQLLETVAERTWLAIEKLRLDAAVRASEEQLHQITDHLPSIISVLNEREEYEFVSRRHEEWLGQTPQQMLGRTLAEMIGEEAYARARPYLQRAYAGEIATFENRLNTINAGVIDVLVTFVPRHTNGGPVTGCYGLVVDITERKQMERMLQRFNEQLAQEAQERTTELSKRMGELDQFAYVTSHDLKAPLRAIDHLARWISEDAAELLPPESRGHLEKMKGRITRMEKLLDDLLAYSRADRYEYNVERVDLLQFVNNIVRSIAPPPGFTIDLQSSQPMLITQKVPLEIVLRNLLSNAVKHHHMASGKVQITVQEHDDVLEVTVQDDGPGIAVEFHERIFQLFQTLKPRDELEGSGMGLAIVKKIVEGRGGHITVDSTPGRGTIFPFTWPK